MKTNILVNNYIAINKHEVSRESRFDSVTIVSRESDLRTFVGRMAAILALIFTLGVGQMWGADVTFDATQDSGDGSITKDGVTVSMSTMNRSQKDNFRCNANSDMTVTSSNTITQIVVTCTENGTSNYGPGKFAVPSGGVGSYTYQSSGKNGTWTGSATSITLHASAQVRITSIVVTYTAAASTYTVSYDANGGTGTMTDSNSPYNSGATVTVLANSFTAPTGYKFDHWNTADDDSGADYDPSETFTISANTTLYAQWAAKSLTNYRTSCSSTPTLSVDPSSLNFGNVANGGSKELTFTLSGSNLSANASVSVTGTGYSVSPTSVTKDGSGNISATITVTYAPTSVGDSQTGTVTVTSGALSETVSLTGNSKATYSVTCSAASNGSVSSNKATAMAGETVTLTITPSSGYQLSTISANNGAVTLDGTGDTRTFTMPASNVTVTSTFVVQTDYVLVESALADYSGEYLIAYRSAGTETLNVLSGRNGNKNANTYGTYTNVWSHYDAGAKAIASNATTDAMKMVVEPSGTADRYTIYFANDESYLGMSTGNTSTGAYLRFQSAIPTANVEHEWRFVWNSSDNVSEVSISNNAQSPAWKWLLYNAGSPRFALYNSGTDIELYKKVETCEKLAAPTGLSVTNKTTTTCTLNWNSVTGASGYEVSLDNGSTWTSNGSNTTYNVTAGAGWTAGSEHTWKVRATGDGDTYCAKGNAANNTVTMLHVYTVTYNANGGSGTLPIAGGVANVDEGGSHVVLGNIGSGGGAVLTKDGYTFANWHSSSSYSASPAYTVGSTISNITSNKILYANWAPKRDTYIDGVHSTADQYGDGANYAVPSCSDESQATSGACDVTHYKFIGWALEDADLTDPANIFKGGTKTATGATYYAVWGEEL